MPARERQHTGASGRVETIGHPVDWATLAQPSDHTEEVLKGLYDEPRRPTPVPDGTDAGSFGHDQHSAAFLLSLIKTHSDGYRAVDPMTAWARDGEVADHGSTGLGECRILGWTSASVLRWTLSRRLDSLNPVAAFRLLDQPEIALLVRTDLDYVVLVDRHPDRRQPPGAISGRDIDLWRVVVPTELEGAFAVDAATYRHWFTRTRIAA